MDMTKSEVLQLLTRGTENAHCTTCAFIPYAGFSQLRSHIASINLYFLVSLANTKTIFTGLNIN